MFLVFNTRFMHIHNFWMYLPICMTFSHEVVDYVYVMPAKFYDYWNNTHFQQHNQNHKKCYLKWQTSEQYSNVQFIQPTTTSALLKLEMFLIHSNFQMPYRIQGTSITPSTSSTLWFHHSHLPPIIGIVLMNRFISPSKQCEPNQEALGCAVICPSALECPQPHTSCIQLSHWMRTEVRGQKRTPGITSSAPTTASSSTLSIRQAGRQAVKDTRSRQSSRQEENPACCNTIASKRDAAQTHLL